MNPALSTVELLHDLYRQCIILLVVNALLSGLAILLAWRSASWKARVEQLEQEMKEQRVGKDYDEPTPHHPLPTLNRPPVPRPIDLKRIPAMKFPRKPGD